MRALCQSRAMSTAYPECPLLAAQPIRAGTASAGNAGGAVLPKAKKRHWNAVARDCLLKIYRILRTP